MLRYRRPTIHLSFVGIDPAQMEDLGSKPKFWFTYSDSDEKGLFLFKADNRGTGEDWAEIVSCELCRLVGIPHVHYDIAFHDDLKLPGVVCRSFIPPSGGPVSCE